MGKFAFLGFCVIMILKLKPKRKIIMLNSLNPDRLIELQNCHSTESVINALKKYDIEAAPNEAQMIMDFVKGEPVSDSSNEWFEIFLRYCNS